MNDPAKGSPSDKLWGGRFAEQAAASLEAFTTSIHYDSRLFHHDITESPARPWTASEAMRRDPLREGGIERAPPCSAAAPRASSPGPRRPL